MKHSNSRSASMSSLANRMNLQRTLDLYGQKKSRGWPPSCSAHFRHPSHGSKNIQPQLRAAYPYTKPLPPLSEIEALVKAKKHPVLKPSLDVRYRSVFTRVPSNAIAVSSQVGDFKVVNQDSYAVKTLAKYTLLGVFDGHGASGHIISRLLSTVVPTHIEKNLRLATMASEELIAKSLQTTANELQLRAGVNAVNSGSTANLVVLQGGKCWCANIGDSRAVLGRQQKEGWIALDLSVDHKPDHPEELKRIEACGGRVGPSRTATGLGIGPPRVWMTEKQELGLAMSRAFGDLRGASVGITSKPDIKEVDLQPSDQFIIVATDGVWDYITSQECVDLISKAYCNKKSPEEACQTVTSEVISRAQRQGTELDDTTLIICYLHPHIGS